MRRSLSWVSAVVVAAGVAAPSAVARGQDLKECLRLGIERSDRLRAARAQVDQVRREADALTPAFFPQLGVDARALWVNVHSTLPEFSMDGLAGILPPDIAASLDFSAFTTVPDRNLDLTLRAYQPLSQIPQIAAGRAALSNAVRLASLGHDLARDMIALGIGSAYFGVLTADRQLDALARAQAQLDRLVADGNSLLAQGVIIRADLLKISIRQREVAVQVVQATNGRDLAKSALGRLIGVPAAEVRVVSVEVDPRPLADLASYLEQGRAGRRELKMGDAAERIAAGQARAAWLAMLPQIGAVATANFNDDHTDMTPDRTYTAGGMLSWNFLGMGADVLKARAADAGRAKAAAEAAALRDEADNAVEKAWRDAVVAREMASAAKATIEQAAESFRAESERYKVGKSTTVELLGAQTQLTAAETGYQAALHGVAMADAALNVAVGRVPFPALMEGSR